MDVQTRIDEIDKEIAAINNNMGCHDWVNSGKGHTVYIPVVEKINATYVDEEFGEIPIRYSRQGTSTNYRSLCPN